MVKNPLKKIKMPKESIMSPEKASAVDAESFVGKKTPSKIKKSKLNGIVKTTPSPKVASEATNGDSDVKVAAKPQVHRHSVGNLKKRLLKESKFITEVLEFMVFPKVNDGESDSEDDGKFNQLATSG